MEQRKIMALGSSFAITLPKSWLRKNNLKQGERVSLTVQQDRTLLVSPDMGVKGKEKVLHLDIRTTESNESILRGIIAGFLNGYTTIKLTSDGFLSVEQHETIRRITSRLYMMIIESGARSITLQTLLDETKASVTSSVERMHVITYSMCRDILDTLQNPNPELLKTVVSLENDVDQLMFLVLRLIRMAAVDANVANRLGLDALDCLDYQTLVHRIERIADHIKQIAKSLIVLIENEISVPRNGLAVISKAAEMAFSYYDLAVSGFLSRDLSDTNEIIDGQREIEDLFMRIMPLPSFGVDREFTPIYNLISIRESIKKISHYSSDIAELTIDCTYKFDE